MILDDVSPKELNLSQVNKLTAILYQSFKISQPACVFSGKIFCQTRSDHHKQFLVQQWPLKRWICKRQCSMCGASSAVGIQVALHLKVAPPKQFTCKASVCFALHYRFSSVLYLLWKVKCHVCVGRSVALVRFGARVQVQSILDSLCVNTGFSMCREVGQGRACYWAACQGPWREAAVSSMGRCAAPGRFLKIHVLLVFPIDHCASRLLLEILESRGFLPSHLPKQCLGRGCLVPRLEQKNQAGRNRGWAVVSGCPSCRLPSVQYWCSTSSLL